MFKVNPMNIGLWSLCGLLVITAIGFIVWRLFSKKAKPETDQRSGVVSKEFNDFIMSLSSTADFQILHNLLIKNKYAKSSYSIIPAIIFTDNNAFLLTNLVKVKAESIMIDENNPKIIKKGKSTLNYDVSYHWSKDILRLLKDKVPNVKFNLVTPIMHDDIKVINKKDNLNIAYVTSFEDDLKKIKVNNQFTKLELSQIIKKLVKLNIFKGKVSANNKSLKGWG